MEFFINCNTSSLAPYTAPLDKTKAEHLYRRLGYSASISTINATIDSSASDLIDTLINDAINAPTIPPPEWANYTNANNPEDDNMARAIRGEQAQEFAATYTNSLVNNSLRDRLSFFWSNHFVTEYGVYDCNSYLFQYINNLQTNAIGNFRTFVSEIGLTNAMLRYLDGAFNRRNRPNENYARELYELFTLGDGNGYTEDDIVETAKALTGYTNRGEIGCSPILYDPEEFNTDTKTIFGQTGNWEYDDVINILFQEKSDLIAVFICTKLYEFFVHPDSTDTSSNAPQVISELAATFVANDFEIAPVLSQLFKSQHFFDDTVIGVIIKSPFDMYLNFLKETNFSFTDELLLNFVDASEMIGQTLFNPVDVAGWQRNRQWINTNFMVGRWLTMETFVQAFYETDRNQFRTLGIEATGVTGETESDPNIVARAIIDKFLPKGLLTEEDYTIAITVFRELYENTNTYETGSWNMNLQDTDLQVLSLLQHIVREPEFQLK